MSLLNGFLSYTVTRFVVLAQVMLQSSYSVKRLFVDVILLAAAVLGELHPLGCLGRD